MVSTHNLLKFLQSSSIKEKREALTYIRSNAKKIGAANAFKEEQYKHLCRLLIDAFTTGDLNVQREAYEALNVIIQELRNHNLHLLESLMQTHRKIRLKVLILLEGVEDEALIAVCKDGQALNFFNDCMNTVRSDKMEWISAEACVDNLNALTTAESKLLSDEEKLEEDMITSSISLLNKFYKLRELSTDEHIHTFDTLLMGKVVTLAYMGHKRQRVPALKLLKQADANILATHIRTKFPDIWTQYKNNVQTVYYKRMALLVKACDPEWACQWNFSIQMLGTDLHRGAALINNLLSVEEKAFKSADTIIRRQAFLSWKLLIDNFALDPHELATTRRIKLLCIPLNAKNSKTELIALTKLEVWWHLIIKLYKDIAKFVNPVLTQFLNFCFGPLGDTPLLSSKFDVVASPGKRFFKTKVVAVHALRQLLVTQQSCQTVFIQILEEKLPHSISDAVFQGTYKSIIHSVGEALLILSQLTDKEMKNRYQLGKLLWTSLCNYIQETKMEKKEVLCKDFVLVITELSTHAVEHSMIKDLIFDVILLELAKIVKQFDFHDDTLSDLILKLLSTVLLRDMKEIHCDAIKCILWHCVKLDKGTTYWSNTLNLFGTMLETIQLNAEHKDISILPQLWCVLADLLTKYIKDSQEINEGSVAEHKFATIESIFTFPFKYVCIEDTNQLQKVAKIWKELYKQFDKQADSITTVTPNEILLNTANMMQNCIEVNKKYSTFAVYCLDALLSTINYQCLLARDEIPSIILLTVNLAINSLNNTQIIETEISIRALSAILITVYGHEPKKVISYLVACKPALDLMLASSSESLYKEICNTWETIINIFKGLNKQLSFDLLSLYRETIVKALNHSNKDVRLQTISFLRDRDYACMNNKTKCLIEEIKTLDKFQTKSDNSKKLETLDNPKQVKLIGSFLNRKSSTPKVVVLKQSKEDAKIAQSLDLDSQEYVFIKSDLKYDVNRLTEHQKESLKRRREDIPAMYNDLSQSSSQDTQNLQEWFTSKSKHIDTIEKTQNTKKIVTPRNENFDHDANKENKIDMRTEIGEKQSVASNDFKQLDNTQSTSTELVLHSTNDSKVNETEVTDSKSTDLQENKTVSNINKVLIMDTSMEEENNLESSDSVAKRLNFENREEFPEDSKQKRSTSPSMLDTGKRRNRNGTFVKTNVQKNEEATNNCSKKTNDPTNAQNKTVQQALAEKDEQSHLDAVNNEEKQPEEKKKGAKRKSSSDSEAEGCSTVRRRKRLTSSENSSDNDNAKTPENRMTLDGIPEDGLSQRTRNEISRLKIDMVFNSGNSLSSRRRSKVPEDGHKETNKDTNVSSGKKASFDNKIDNRNKKSSDNAKPGESNKKGSKPIEKETKSTTTQFIAVRRTRRSLKPENEKNEEQQNTSESKPMETDNHQSKTVNEVIDNNLNDDSTSTNSSQPLEQASSPKRLEETKKIETENDKVQVNKTTGSINRNEAINSNNTVQTKNIELYKASTSNTEQESHSQSQMDDIVEGSQEVNGNLLSKKYGDKECFIKIDKINETDAKSKLMNSDKSEKSTSCEETIILENNDVTPVKPNKTLVIANLPEASDSITNEGPKTTTTEESTTTTSITISNTSITVAPITTTATTPTTTHIHDSVTPKPASANLISSPKSNTLKGLSKFKNFSTHGRAAHMLGLVTKQALAENDNAGIRIEDDVNKKQKFKDTEIETLTIKKDKPVTKETEKITGPSGSRQEKIFNNMNMKSTDYSSPPPPKLFSNLKNDGEKISSKVEKISDNTSIGSDHPIASEQERVSSPMHEVSELPILEWSSANPPSLTASPSASILKRQRSSAPESDTDASTPSKRKRVSFADPPVSKEMGYEISSGSPHKINKPSTPRSLLNRRELPFRFKQTKLRFIQLDSEKTGKEDSQMDTTSEVGLQCEKENELLTKIAEELEYSEHMTVNINSQASCSFTETMQSDNISNANKDAGNQDDMLDKGTTENLDADVEMKDSTEQAESTHVDKNKQIVSSEQIMKEQNYAKFPETMESQVSDTQEDIFGCDNTKDAAKIITEPINENSEKLPSNGPTDQIKFNVTNDSVLAALPENNTDDLEDTIDVQNMSSFNSSANSDEFCEKLIRTSTQTNNNIAEQDTLPITDSILSSQDSQKFSQMTAEFLKPELLDSEHPIYPELVSCQDPIDSIVKQLANPMWVSNLSTLFANRNLRTVGDLAQLSEREINRLPIKGSPKIQFLKKVLKRFESMRSISSNAPMQLNQTTSNMTNTATTSNVTMSVTKTVQSTPTTTNSQIEHSDHKYCSSKIDDSLNTNVIVSSSFTPTNKPSVAYTKVTTSASTSSENTHALPISEIASIPASFVTVSTRATTSDITTQTFANHTKDAPTQTTLLTTKSSGVGTDPVFLLRAPLKTIPKPCTTQVDIERLLDELDINLLLKSVSKRTRDEAPTQPVPKPKQKPTEVIIDTESLTPNSEVALRAACRASGLNKVLLRLPDIFASDKEFFSKVLTAYRMKIKTKDFLSFFSLTQLKDEVLRKCSSWELTELLSKKLKQEENSGNKLLIRESSFLNTIFSKIPTDVLISHTVANDDLIPSSTVLDIALQNNSATDIVRALETHAPVAKEIIRDDFWSSRSLLDHVKNKVDDIQKDKDESREQLFEMFRIISSKLSAQELLDAYHESMETKLMSIKGKE